MFCLKTENNDKKAKTENHAETENGIKDTKNEAMEEFKVETIDKVETKTSNNKEAIQNGNDEEAKMETSSTQGKKKKTYRCKTCRSEMFNEEEMVHGEAKGCTSYFLRRFMGMEGKLYCLNNKCKEKIGELTLSGAKCSCGEWIVPGYRLTKSKVDNVV